MKSSATAIAALVVASAALTAGAAAGPAPLEARAGLFAGLDTNANGFLSSRELAPGLKNGRNSAARTFRRLDLNRDRRLSLAEFTRLDDILLVEEPGGRPIEPPALPVVLELDRYLGLTEDQALALARDAGFPARVISRDGTHYIVPAIYIEDRINFVVVASIVVSAYRG
jgi:hypothetical protein